MDQIDRDLAIRTVLSEAGGQGDAGMAAVAHVIRNRMAVGKYGGRSAAEVVTAPNQFEPWNDVGAGKGNDPLAYSATDPAYQKAGNIVDAVFSGAMRDPTGGATHFYAPKAQAELGRKAPKWAAGQQGRRIGDHVFYAPDGTVSDLSQGLGQLSQDPDAPTPKPAADTGGPTLAGGAMPSLGGGGSLSSQDLLRMFMGKMSNPTPAPQTHGFLNQLLFGPQGWQGKLGQSLPNGLLGALGGGGSTPTPAAPPATPGAGQPLDLAKAAAAPGPGTLPTTQAPSTPTALLPGGGAMPMAPEGPPAIPGMPGGAMPGGGQSPIALLQSLFGGM